MFLTYAAPPGLEWKPKSAVPKQAASEIAVETGPENVTEKTPQPILTSVSNESPVKLSPLISAPPDTEPLSIDSSPKPEKFGAEDDRPVIIPEHLQVAEADSAGLSFGSFDVDFEILHIRNFGEASKYISR